MQVSRRKDGQRFKLRIEVDQEQCTANVADLTPIFTNAICVLSKRKHHHHSSSSDTGRGKEPPPKLLKRGGFWEAWTHQQIPLLTPQLASADLAKLEERLGDKMDRMLVEVSRLQRHVAKQNELISKHLVAVPVGLSSVPDSGVLDWFLKPGNTDECVPLSASGGAFLNPSAPFFDGSSDSHDGSGDFAGSPPAHPNTGAEASRATLPFPQI